MLTVAAILCDAGAVVGVDVDEDALETCRMNLESFDPAMEAELARADVAVGVSTRRRATREDEEGEGEEDDAGRATSRSQSVGKTDRRPPSRLRCDTVVMNPPFGTRRAGADVAFLLSLIHI